MAKAWMPFYIADYLADTGHLDHEEHGVYVLAIFHYWQTEKPLPDNVKQLLSICRCFDKAKFEQIWSVVSSLFVLTENGWIHERIERELEKAKNISESRKLAGSKGGKNKQAKAKAKDKQLLPQSQSQSPFKYMSEFEEYWSKYPKKDGKKAALKHFKASVNNDEDLSNFGTAFKNYVNSVKDTDRQYIKNGSTFFNNWHDFVEMEDQSSNFEDERVQEVGRWID